MEPSLLTPTDQNPPGFEKDRDSGKMRNTITKQTSFIVLKGASQLFQYRIDGFVSVREIHQYDIFNDPENGYMIFPLEIICLNFPRFGATVIFYAFKK